MANGMGVQLAIFLVPLAIIVCVLLMRKRKAEPAEPVQIVQPVAQRVAQPKTVQAPAAAPTPAIAVKAPAAAVPVEVAPTTAIAASSAPPPAKIDVQGVLAAPEDRRERILAGITENIRKSLETRQATQSSPILYAESKPRNTEYVRVKKDIITPHGQVRFSILKDWLSVNMLAIFRRASYDWKTPDDLIALVPKYLEPEAEVLNGQLLLIGTPGHNETLAVPIRNLDESFRECFEFVSDVETNTPAVLRTSDEGFEIVSRGVITQAVFTNAIEQKEQWETNLLVNRTPMRQLDSPVGADAR